MAADPPMLGRVKGDASHCIAVVVGHICVLVRVAFCGGGLRLRAPRDRACDCDVRELPAPHAAMPVLSVPRGRALVYIESVVYF